jgi:hypothetical protein
MTTPNGEPSSKHARISREELDRLFDRELSGTERRDLVGRLGRDPLALDEVSDVRRMINTMRTGQGPTPDLTDAVMDRLDRSTGFLSPRLRRRVKTGRLAAAACVLVALLGVAIAQRTAPERFRTRAIATPVADFSDAVRQDSAEGRQRLSDAVTTLAAAKPTPPFLCAPREPAQAGAHPAPQAVAVIHVETAHPPEVPPRYLTLTASADAEVLALSNGGPRGLVITTIRTLETEMAFADTTDAQTPQGTTTAIRAGVVPLSFGTHTVGTQTRAAYVGKRYILPPAILHDTQYPVSRLEHRP